MDDTDTKDVDGIISVESHPQEEKTEDTVDQDSPKKHNETDIDHTPSTDALSPEDADKRSSEIVEPEINEPQEEQKENEEVKGEDRSAEDDQTNTKEEEKEEQEESPLQPPGLEQLSIEIDQYILTLSASTPKAKADIDIDTVANADTNTNADASADIDTNANVDTDTNASADTDTNVNADTHADTDTDANVNDSADTDINVNADADADTNTNANANANAKADTNTNTNANDTNTDANANDSADTDTNVDADANVNVNVNVDADADSNTNASADTDTNTNADADADTNTNVNADTNTNTNANANADTDAKADTDTESTPPPDDVLHFIQQFINLVEDNIGGYDSKDNPVKWSHLTGEDSSLFLESIYRLLSLSSALSRFSSDKQYSGLINHTGRVLQRAMSYLEEEFKSLLEDYKINDTPLDPSPVIDDTKPSQDPKQDPPPESEVEPAAAAPEEHNFFPGYSDGILSNLVRLSKAMIAGGHETECFRVYFVARRNALEGSLQKIGFEKYSIDEVQRMSWEPLERDIVTWITTFKQTTAVHFPKEKNLFNSVFGADQHPSSMSESLFCSLSQCMIIQLLNFSAAVALTKRAAEKLFKFLDMYEALRETIPAMEDLFPEDMTNEIKTEVSRIKGRLGETMIMIFTELENSIKADASKTPVPGGAVHPLARYIMNYLKLACEYRGTLEQVFREHQKIERADSNSGSDFNYNPQAGEAVKQSPFQAQMVKVMDLLDANLDGKSKLYKDHALSSIFMMNNGRYILQKVKSSNEIISLMGDSWCRHRSSELRQYHKGYQRETWGKLLHCLHPDGLMSHGKVSKPVLKERFHSFNTMFAEIHRTQSAWVVSDEQLQSELRISIANMVIPAYRSFLGRYSQNFTPGRQTEKYVKYQGEDIETYIDELFDGSAAPAGRKW